MAYVWDEGWLERGREEVLDPELVIVDPHHHLWERGVPYLLDELHADTGAGHRVEATVFVECLWSYRTDGPEHLRPVGETEAVVAVAEGSAASGAEIAGIVAFADMTLGADVGEVLDAHEEAGRGRFRGIRHVTAYDPDPRVRRSHTHPPPELMGDERFRAGVRCLAERGHSFDAWLYSPQIPELTALARAVPECTFVLDHLGGMLGVGPYEGRRAEVLERWRPAMAELATCPNVVVKLGGIGMAVFGLGFERQPEPPSSEDLVASWGGPIAHVIELFGVERCMFESNFPVDKVSCSYTTLWNAFTRMVADAGATDDERAALFSGTASSTYRLARPDHTSS